MEMVVGDDFTDYYFDLSNYYGQVFLHDSTYEQPYLCLEDWCSDRKLPIPQYLRDALIQFYKESSKEENE